MATRSPGSMVRLMSFSASRLSQGRRSSRSRTLPPLHFVEFHRVGSVAYGRHRVYISNSLGAPARACSDVLTSHPSILMGQITLQMRPWNASSVPSDIRSVTTI